MSAQPHSALKSIPAEQLTDEVREAIERLVEETELLRAALASAQASESALAAESSVDGLTGLASETELKRALARSVSQAQRHGTTAALVSIDLKGLAQLNAAHGRVAGDAALAHVARLVRGLIRSSDVAARNGAGLLLLLDHLDPDSAVDTAERIARFIASQPLDLGHRQVRIQTTIGVATILSGDSPDDVFARAETNLRRVKELQ